mmetsp:Transcript_32060/g.43906  ORF Transcript_32060/g.43906 Transcript_32060/m.43906 type:complete len:489 (+) Transcript_32060:500-1966(+)
MTIQDIDFFQSITRNGINMNLGVLSTNHGNRGVHADSNALGTPRHILRRNLLGSVEEVDALYCNNNRKVTRTSRNALSRAINRSGIVIFTIERGNPNGIVKTTRKNVSSLSRKTTNLIGVSLSRNFIIVSGIDIPSGDNRVVASSVDCVSILVMSESGNELVVSLDHTKRNIGIRFVQISKMAVQSQAHQEITLPQATKLHIIGLVGERKVRDTLVGLNIPNFTRFVSGTTQKLSSISIPADGINSHLMFLGESTLLFTSLPVIQKDLFVLTSGSKDCSRGIETNTVHETGMILDVLLPFEGGSFKPLDRVIFRTGNQTVGTSGFHIASGQFLGSTADLTNTRTTVSEENTSEFLLTISNDTNSLAVRRPRNISDRTKDHIHFKFANSVFSNTIPNADSTTAVSRSDVISAGGITSNGWGMSVFSVLITKQRVGKISHHDRISCAIQDLFSLGVTTEVNRQSTSGGGKGGIPVLFRKGRSCHVCYGGL